MLGDRFNRSWQVAKDSFAVLKGNPALAVFPVLSTIAVVLASIPFLAALIPAFMVFQKNKQAFDVLHYVLMAGMYFVNYFVVIFFNSALVACANESLQGRPTNVAFGVKAAVARLPQILGWALIASTVGMILRTIAERTGIIGQIVTSIIGLAWNLAVYFVVPCLVLDNESPIAALKSSTGMIKRTWGERLILGIGIGTAMVALFMLAMVPVVLGIVLIASAIYWLAAISIITGVVLILGLSVISSAMTTIYQTALYIYSRNGGVPAGFELASMEAAFAVKPASKLFRR